MRYLTLNLIKLAIWIVLSVLFAACSQPAKKATVSDSAPEKSIDVSKIPDAVPRNEPRSRYGNPESYEVFGKRYYVMESSQGFVERGVASWYGTKFHGRRTSSGETYDMYAMTAAHKNLPLPTYVKVTNLKNNRHVIVKVNDRGPFHENRIIDLSYTAATKLDIVKQGTGLVEVVALEPGQPLPVSRDEGAPVVDTSIQDSEVSGFYIQVGSFSELTNAQNMKRRLDALAGQQVNISPIELAGKTLYRVRIGPLTDIDTSDEIVSQLQQYGVSEHRIVVN